MQKLKDDLASIQSALRQSMLPSSKPQSTELPHGIVQTFPNPCIAMSAPGLGAPFRVLGSSRISDWHYMGDTQLYGLFAYLASGQRVDNITDWSLKKLCDKYRAVAPSLDAHRRAKSAKSDADDHVALGEIAASSTVARPPAASMITKLNIFHYVYAVLREPLYRDKYAVDLKRKFPRIPFYGDTLAVFHQWSACGAELMALHIDYESVEPASLQRVDVPDLKARNAGQSPKPILKSDPDGGRVVLDSESTLSSIPRAAWDYRLGNRSAIDWVLDQHKEKKPKDATIRALFDTYRFADYKEKVVDLLARVTTVSVRTVAICEAMKRAPR